jgi:HEAT repeat protein
MTALSDGLADRRAVVRRNAATILGLLDNRSAVPMLKEHLADPDPVVRLNVAESLARLGNTSGLPLIRRMASDAESPLQVNAILALGRVGTASRDVPRLRELEASAGGSDSAVRLAAFCARGQMGDYAQMPALIEVATGKESRRRVAPGHRAFALQLLARVAYGPAWREVAGSLDDGHPYVRLSAAWAMLSFSSPRARRVLKAVTRPDSPQRLSEQDILRPAPRTEPEGSPGGPLDVRRRNLRNSPLRPNFP